MQKCRLFPTVLSLACVLLPVWAKVPTGGSYSIEVKDFLKGGESVQRLLVRGKGRTFLDATAHNFAVVDPFSANPNLGLEHARLLVNDLTGDKKQSLIIRTWSGGAHCCYSYDIYSIAENFKKIWHFDAHDGHMLTARRNHQSPPTLYIEDATFRYWDVGVPAMPVVALQWNGRTFSPVHSKGVRTLDVKDDQKATVQLLKSLRPTQRQEFYECIVKLYYSGDADLAMRYMRKFENASYNSAHSDFVRQLRTSPFYEDVRAINHGVL